MTLYEYRVVPAPKRGLKGKGVKGGEARFANALETAINDLAAEGWDYVRTDTLPFEERDGLMSKSTSFQNLLVFRRPRSEAEEISDETREEILAIAPPEAAEPEPEHPPLAARRDDDDPDVDPSRLAATLDDVPEGPSPQITATRRDTDS